jgi:hypothetical protein
MIFCTMRLPLLLLAFSITCYGFQLPITSKSTTTATATTSLKVASSLPYFGTTAVVNEPALPKVGVLLLNLGGPERGEDVEGMSYPLEAGKIPAILNFVLVFLL